MGQLCQYEFDICHGRKDAFRFLVSVCTKYFRASPAPRLVRPTAAGEGSTPGLTSGERGADDGKTVWVLALGKKDMETEHGDVLKAHG
jgi:hypothetical protein